MFDVTSENTIASDPGIDFYFQIIMILPFFAVSSSSSN